MSEQDVLAVIVQAEAGGVRGKRPVRLVVKRTGYYRDRIGGVVQCTDDDGYWYDIDRQAPEARAAYPAILDALARERWDALLDAQAQQADVAAREADRVAREERHYHDD